MDAHNLTIGCCNQISMVQLLYSSSPIGTIIEQNLNMAPVIYFCVLNIFQNMFLPPLHFCNEPKKTDKHNLNSYEDLLMFHFFYSFFLNPCRCYCMLQGSLVVVELPLPWLEDYIQDCSLYSYGTLSGRALWFCT
jgi:hypothetical protein